MDEYGYYSNFIFFSQLFMTKKAFSNIYEIIELKNAEMPQVSKAEKW